MDDIYEDTSIRGSRANTRLERSKAPEEARKAITRKSGSHSFGPSPWWLLGFITSKLSITLIVLSTLTFPHLVWNLLGEHIRNFIHIYKVWEILDSGNWYLSAVLAGVWTLLFAREVLYYVTEAYRFDPSTQDLICVSFRNRMENYVSLSLVYDIDIHKSSLLNYLTGTGHIVLKHSTPENRSALTYLLWVRHPEKVRDFMKSLSGVSNARFVVSV